jgi:hypothetical protein
MAHSEVGKGSAYAFTPHDAQGRFLDGGKAYRVTLPAPSLASFPRSVVL